jgi:hypothetical protein
MNQIKFNNLKKFMFRLVMLTSIWLITMCGFSIYISIFHGYNLVERIADNMSVAIFGSMIGLFASYLPKVFEVLDEN